MEFVSVIAAAAAAWIFGAIWYGILGKAWMAAAELKEGDFNPSNPVPFIVSFLMVVLVAGMTRHILSTSGVTDAFGSAVSGFGLGLFIAVPWIVTNYTYAGRRLSLILIDGTYAAVGTGLIGLVLGLL